MIFATPAEKELRLKKRKIARIQKEERMAEMHKSLRHRKSMLYSDTIDKFDLKEL
jgi:hypothetical protein